jgi:hypothetical protein
MIRFLGDMARVLNMPCRAHTELLTRQLDGPLSAGETFGLRLHLLICTGCRRFRSQIRRIRSIILSMQRETQDGPPMPQAVRERVLAHLTDSRRQD